MKRLSNGASNALWTAVCLVVLGALSACDGSDPYCYKGHDEMVTDGGGGHWVMKVCDEWRDTASKYPAEASDATAR